LVSGSLFSRHFSRRLPLPQEGPILLDSRRLLTSEYWLRGCPPELALCFFLKVVAFPRAFPSTSTPNEPGRDFPTPRGLFRLSLFRSFFPPLASLCWNYFSATSLSFAASNFSSGRRTRFFLLSFADWSPSNALFCFLCFLPQEIVEFPSSS